jgi:hypothetical protein
MAIAQIHRQVILDAAEKRISNLAKRISEEGDVVEKRRLQKLEILRKPRFPRFWKISFEEADRRWGLSCREALWAANSQVISFFVFVVFGHLCSPFLG